MPGREGSLTDREGAGHDCSGGTGQALALCRHARCGGGGTLSGEIARVLGPATVSEVDLAPFGPRVLDPADAAVTAAVAGILGADVLVVASPTYKAAYSGLLKAFPDRSGTGSLAGVAAVPVLLGGAPDHRLAVDVIFTPLLLELGAAVRPAALVST
jgi:NAD(P)H-dependent FMN reductase